MARHLVHCVTMSTHRIRLSFSETSGISNILLSLGFGIPLLRLILLAFRMLILGVVELTKRTFMVFVIFWDLLLFAGLLKNNLQLLNPP
jgi:hypothetical protein